MKFDETDISGCFVIEPDIIEDERGGFFRFFCKDEFREIIADVDFVQMNHSINKQKGTFRGMHYQKMPYSEGKLIRCVSGSVMDYFLDLRKGSPTFMEYREVELSASNRKMVYLPKGIAHGFFTLENNTELLYHHTQKYSPAADAGIKYNDSMVDIKLPFSVSMISEKDQNYSELTNEFRGVEL